MGIRQARAHVAANWPPEILTRAPPTCRKALRTDKVESIPLGPQVLVLAENEIRLHGAAHRVDMAVGVFARKHILSRRQRSPIPAVGKKVNSNIAVSASRPSLPCKELFFRQRV